jgi:predicted phosphodiesterase
MSIAFRIVSDLHLDGCMMSPRKDIGADYALIAGDSVNGSSIGQLPQILEHLFPEPKIMVIMGNHEGYRQFDFDQMCARFAASCAGTRVVPLQRTSIELPGGIVLLGSTLWTDFELFGKHRIDDSMSAAAACMMDYRVLGKNGVAIRPDDSLAWHQADRAWIESQAKIHAGKRMVCMTHHGPRRDSLAKKYAMDAASAGFISHLPDSVLAPFELWVHGHTHTSFDYKVGGCRVICNPRGYTSIPDIPLENPQFDPDLLIRL